MVELSLRPAYGTPQGARASDRTVAVVRNHQSMYPGDALLMEVGRVAIAGARLEIWMGFLWWQLNPAIDELKARRSSFGAQRRAVLALVDERLDGSLRTLVLDAVATAQTVLDKRHEVIHQDWLINSQEHIRAAGNLVRRFGADQGDHLDEVERYAHDSDNWSRLPARGLQIDEALTQAELVEIERQLSEVLWHLAAVVRQVASARVVGLPVGYLRGPLVVSRKEPKAPRCATTLPT